MCSLALVDYDGDGTKEVCEQFFCDVSSYLQLTVSSV